MIVRLTLAALFVIPAAMAYPWQTTFDRWLLGVAVAVVVILFAWWRGLFVTTLVARRIRLLTRRGRSADDGDAGEFATVALRVEQGQADLPLALAADHLDRYGIAFDKVRVTSREAAGHRTTWVSLTLGAASNIAALTARSPQIPLQDTVEVAARRLADHLRERGWEVTIDDAPGPLPGDGGKETWRGVVDGHGHLAAYRVRVDERLTETLAAAGSAGTEFWSAVEFTGSRTSPEIAASCALRTTDRPPAIAGLTAERGLHRSALDALGPTSHRRLLAPPVPATPELVAQLRLPVGAILSRT
ncbi:MULTISPECIES: type VII secretion protein EccE [Mycolicibacterium]|uniref:Type VII secretion system protein EccE domain-containing protein n=2 Tax=Mycolicibacterium gilvum TaxID=1804 RepID=E6TMQ5_MYCSR|nr:MULTISPECIES: type VII secretion protein EccE [Mycolicibacterium]ABP42813.1 putative conserved transmembrane protein [Mycolicibacterium gilvum PYR-GCK]ADT97151.1 hypothetical protein Mspyr1_04390 [Mycolicibacterium gilvum Spyr1]MBV5244672.1 type VII secretion protein EccE [Mycolicibacterium sp. PAM1]